jgi:hypothetical protein
VLESLMESEMLAEEAEPALEADEVKLVACAWVVQAAAKVARQRARERAEVVMQVFLVELNKPMLQVLRAAEKATAADATLSL